MPFKPPKIKTGGNWSTKQQNPLEVWAAKQMMEEQQKKKQAESLPEGFSPQKAVIDGVTYKSPTSDQKVRDALMNIKNQKQYFGNMKESIGSVPQGRISGGISKLKAYISGGKGDEGSNSLFYSDNKPALAVALYRDITGDTRTSDADAASRALPLLPDQIEHPDLVTKKLANIENALNVREQLLSTGSFQMGEDGSLETPEVFSQSINALGQKAPAQNGGGIEMERKNALLAIQSGKDAKKIADIFRSRTGQELNG